MLSSILKGHAAGQWRNILIDLGMPPESLDGKHHSCPKCGGVDRFRAFDDLDTSGGVFCNQCLNDEGDGFATIMWWLECDFLTAKREVEKYLNIGDSSVPFRPSPATVKATEAKPVKPPKKPAKVFSTAAEAMAQAAEWVGRPHTEVWAYNDDDGKKAVAVMRYESEDGLSKEFRQVSYQRTTDTGTDQEGWVVGLGERFKDKRPMYNLGLLKMRDPSQGPVFVVEGEKCADGLMGIGLMAVTSLNGSASPKKTDWSPLRGYDVVIFPDNDPAGEKYAEKVTGLLRDSGVKSVVTANIEGLPEKGDVWDWLEERDAKEPQDLAEALLAMAKEAGTGEEPADEPERRSAIRSRVPASELKQDFGRPRPVVIDGVLRKGETLNVIGAAKAGKSWLSIDLAMSVAMGDLWMGEFQTTQGRVYLIDNELHGETLNYRLETVANAKKYDMQAVGANLDVSVMRGQPVPTDLLSLLDDMMEFVAPGEYSLVVLDAWYRFIPEKYSENDNAQMMQLYNKVDQAAMKLGCAFVVIHHASKGNQADKAITDVGAGAGSIARATDTHLIIRPHAEEGMMVVDAAARSFRPLESRTVKFEWPLWSSVPDVEPELKTSKTALSRDKAQNMLRGTWEILEALRNKSKDPDGIFRVREIQTITGLGRVLAREPSTGPLARTSWRRPE